MPRSKNGTILAIGAGVAGLAVLAVAMASPTGRRLERRVEIKIMDWMDTLLAKTSEHEGTYWSIQRNLDGQGVSYGIIQWTQKGGGLYTVLAAMQRADPATFAATFGGASLSQALLAHTAARNMGPLDGANLWDPPWLGRFASAGHVPAFQQAQRDTAKRGEHMQGAIAVAQLLGVSSERALVICYNRSVHQGPAGAMGVAKDLVALYASGRHPRPPSEIQVLAEYGWLCAAQFRIPKNLGNGRRQTVPSSPMMNDTTRWVQLPAGSQELNLQLVGSNGVRLVREDPGEPTWHAVTGQWDLWDLILNRTYQHLTDASLRDDPVALAAVA